MVILGVLFLLVGFWLIGFRESLSAYRGPDENGVLIFVEGIQNSSRETTFLYIGGLVAILGIGMILLGLANKKSRDETVEKKT